MRKLLLPLALAATIASGSFAFAATDHTVTGTLKAIDAKACTVTLGKSVYHFAKGCDFTAFKVGENIATTKGAVVWENELVQLLQYEPLTAKVHERPLVMVPPCINKFYIMDLQPENSLVRFALAQGPN